MANGRNEADCTTCVYLRQVGGNCVCDKHGRVIPIQARPYLICNAWQHRTDPNRNGAYFKLRYFNDPTVLYSYDVYFLKQPEHFGLLSELAPSIE
jgi:hypothetical protein